MDSVRQKRKSCEACRARKLRCSGEMSGCLRCLKLSLHCKFQDKGPPGRPRKLLEGSEKRNQQRRQEQLASPNRPSPVTPPRSTDSAGSPEVANTSSANDSFSFLIDPPGSNNLDFDSFPQELLGLCNARPQDTSTCGLSLNTSIPPGLLQPSCECAEGVTESVRTLKRTPLSHDIIRNLRAGADLSETLLSCPVCYDQTKPPRITIQNVLLIGRLMLEVTAGYRRYLKWLEESCNELADSNQSETVYLIPGLEISPVLGFKISGQMLRDVIVHGLRSDAERLSALGRKFALRQHNRHMVGHEACPDAEGRCWKEEYGVNVDPSDVCPKDCSAKSLTPCYRVVDEVCASIKQVVDAVA